MPSFSIYEDDMDKYEDYEWIRANKLALKTDDDGENIIFTDRIGPNEFKPGCLGNYYFLSALSAIAEKPARIKKLVDLSN